MTSFLVPFCSVPPSMDGAGSTEEVTVVRGNTASFICIADGAPSPTITWLRNGAVMPKDAHLSLLNQNSTLQISHARINHTGRYTCTAHNQAGDASRHFSLRVLGERMCNKTKWLDWLLLSQTHWHLSRSFRPTTDQRLWCACWGLCGCESCPGAGLWDWWHTFTLPDLAEGWAAAASDR